MKRFYTKQSAKSVLQFTLMFVVFSNPGMLWGLIGLSIPVIIHLLLKRRPVVIEWGAMTFLQRVVQRRKSELKVRSHSHFILRLLLITLVVLALANPRFASEGAMETTVYNTHRLIIFDVSMSMSASEDGEQRLDHAQQEIQSLIAKSKHGDSWQILLHGTNDSPVRIRVPNFDPQIVSEVLSNLTTSFTTGNINETLRHAVELVEEFPGTNNEIIFFTDFQKHEWDVKGADAYEVNAQLEQLSKSANLVFVNIGAQSLDNLAITEIDVPSHSARIGEMVNLRVKVENFSDGSQNADVQLFANSELISSELTTIAANETSIVDFEVVFNDPGLKDLRVKITEGGMSSDDERHCLLNVLEQVNILIIEDASVPEELTQSVFLQLALPGQEFSRAPQPILTNPQPLDFRIKLIEPTAIAKTPLTNYDVIISCGLSQLSEADYMRILQFAEDGGGLLFSMDNAPVTQRMRELLGPQGVALLPVEITDRRTLPEESAPFQIAQFKTDHPVMSIFQENQGAALKSTRIYSYFDSRNANDDVILARLDNGAALILEQPIGLGKCYLITTSFLPSWGSWVLWPSFLPLMQRIIEDLTFQERKIVEVTLGNVFSEELIVLDHFDLIMSNNGEILVKVDSAIDTWPKLLESEMKQPGLYHLSKKSSEEVRQTVILHPDTRDSDLKKLNASTIFSSQALKGIEFRWLNSSDALIENVNRTALRARTSLSMWLLIIASLLLLIDLLFANRSGLATLLLLVIAVSLLIAIWLPDRSQELVWLNAILIACAVTLQVSWDRIKVIIESNKPFTTV